MANAILQVKKPIIYDDDIISQQYHTYTPYSMSFNCNDEIRIPIQSQELYVLPSESYLHIEFSVTKKDGTLLVQNEANFSTLFISHLFSEMRYELNNFEIDRCKSPGITSILKLMLACKTENRSSCGLYSLNSEANIATGSYQMIVPLRFLFGFCDDFDKIVLNSKHELILVRSRSDTNAYIADNDIANFTVNKVVWKVPHISLSDQAKLTMLKTISKNDSLPLLYRSWDLYELPIVPQTTRYSWNIKTTTQVTKPRYVLVAFQRERNFVPKADISQFDHCNISNVKLYLNNERYPYDDLNLNFGANCFHEAFYMLANIQQSYYSKPCDINPITMNLQSYANRPVFAFDCSRSDESIKKGMVDVRIDIEARENIPPNTAAYCLIIHDNLVRYSPFSSIVHREI